MKPPKVQIIGMVDAELRDAIDAEAERRGISRSCLVRIILEAFKQEELK